MHARRSLAFVFFMLFVIAACGPSPLFHHRTVAEFASEAAAATDKPGAPSPACVIEFTQLDVCGSIAWTLGPRSGKASAFTFTATNKNGLSELPAGTLEVELWMPSMGHGSADVEVAEKAPGTFEATNVQFIMHGEWEVRLRWVKDGVVVDSTSVMIKI